MSGVTSFDLSYCWPDSGYFDLPSEFFENSKSLRNLRLRGFRFSQNIPMDYKVQKNLKHLQVLTLMRVHIVDKTFQKLMSSCHFIEHVVLNRCEGLTTIRLMNNNSYLKRFELFSFHEEDLCFVGVPNLESMKINLCGSWFNIDRHRNMYFPGLKSLDLNGLRFSPTRPSLDILTSDFPSLQQLYIFDCKGFSELRVSNSSIKKLTISCLGCSIKVVVDAPVMEVLNFVCSFPFDISFSNECKSYIKPGPIDVLSEDDFLDLSRLLKALSQSKIYLELPSHEMEEKYFDDDYHDIYGGHDDQPVMVDYIHLDNYGHGYFYCEDFLNHMFRYCRPRNILERKYYTWRTEFLCKVFLLKQNNESPWQRDLEDASIQVWDQDSKEWCSVEGTTFLESGAPPPSDIDTKQYEVWFKLKWRE